MKKLCTICAKKNSKHKPKIKKINNQKLIEEQINDTSFINFNKRVGFRVFNIL